MVHYIGIDLGGTKIAGGILDGHTEELIIRKVIPTEAHHGPDAVLKRIATLVKVLCHETNIHLNEIGGVGVGVPAAIDMENGQTLVLPTMPGNWYGKPVVSILQENLKCPVFLINDARAFTLAEATLGAGKHAASVAGITLGTGIGGGIAIDGKLYLGAGGGAGEFGHHIIDLQGTKDGTGNRGDWEAIASGSAIAAMGAKVVMQGFDTQIGALVDYDLNRITPQVILKAAEAGDRVAQEILQQAGEYIGTGIANIITILAPSCVVIGGDLTQLGDRIMNPVMTTIQERVHTVPLAKVEIVFAALGGNAGIIGAAVWASQLSSGDIATPVL